MYVLMLMELPLIQQILIRLPTLCQATMAAPLQFMQIIQLMFLRLTEMAGYLEAIRCCILKVMTGD